MVSGNGTAPQSAVQPWAARPTERRWDGRPSARRGDVRPAAGSAEVRDGQRGAGGGTKRG